MRSIVMLAAMGAAVLAGAPAATGPKPVQTGFLYTSLTCNGQEYRYAVYVPRKYDATRKWPLILFLHGGWESGTDGRKQVTVGLGAAIQKKSGDWPFIVLFPQKPQSIDAWETHDAALMEMVARARSGYNVDGSRLYLTGLSQGGHGTWVLGARHANLWAAIAPICGYAALPKADPTEPVPAFPLTVDGQIRRALVAASWPNGKPIFPATVKEMVLALKGTPIWAFHGDADKTVPVTESKDLVAAVKAAGGHARITLYRGVDHNCWDNAYGNGKLGAWFLAQTRAK